MGFSSIKNLQFDEYELLGSCLSLIKFLNYDINNVNRGSNEKSWAKLSLISEIFLGIADYDFLASTPSESVWLPFSLLLS